MEENETIRVLLVDDEDRFRKTAAATLRRHGFNVKAVADGWDAVKEMWRDDYDVVVLDIKMPGMDGHRALREIKVLRPNVQVIMLTGHGSMDSALESWRDEAFTYLTKPCDIDTLAEMIECAYAVKANSTDSKPSAAQSSKYESTVSGRRRWPFRKRDSSKMTRLKGGK